jgi:predicted ATPase
MITRFRLENFKAHRDTDLRLHRFTVLVGDNSSGKTSVLEALRLPAELFEITAHTDELKLDERLRRGAERMSLSYEGEMREGQWTTTLEITGFGSEPTLWLKGQEASQTPFSWEFDLSSLHEDDLREHLSTCMDMIGRVALYRFRADQVAASAYSDKAGVLVAEDGAQTAVVLADLKLADDERFDRIEGAMRRLVPSLERLRIAPAMVEHRSSTTPVRGSKVYFDFHGAKNVPGHHASQGTLVALALLTVLHGADRPGVILLDEFDHSLHPRAQMELVRMIKELLALDEFQDTQLIMTTHSPYVLDEVSPAEVIAFALRDDGTVAAKPLSEHPDAPRVNGSLKAGELWTLDAERDWVR